MVESTVNNKMNTLVNNLVQKSVIKTKRIADVMKKVDRGHFCVGGADPYKDSP